MPWFRMEDAILENPKVTALTAPQFRAWVRMLACAARAGTDGAVALKYLEKYLNPRTLKSLERKGLLERVEIDGRAHYRPHDWLDYQPTTADLQKRKEANRERVRRHRERKKLTGDEGDVTALHQAGCNAPERFSSAIQRTIGEIYSLSSSRDQGRREVEIYTHLVKEAAARGFAEPEAEGMLRSFAALNRGRTLRDPDAAWCGFCDKRARDRDAARIGYRPPDAKPEPTAEEIAATAAAAAAHSTTEGIEWWREARARAQRYIARPAYETWWRPLRYLGSEGEVHYVGAPALKWVRWHNERWAPWWAAEPALLCVAPAQEDDE